MYAIVVHCGGDMGDMFVTEYIPNNWAGPDKVKLFKKYEEAVQHASTWKKGSASVVRYDESKSLSEMERC